MQNWNADKDVFHR